VNLRGLDWKELLSHGPPALWPLVALTRDGAREAVIEKARDAIEARTAWSSSERADHLAVLWFVAEAENVPAKVIRAYLSEGRLMESELYKSIFEKGEARGEARGEAKGEAKAYMEMLVQLLIHRMGTLAPAIRERIRAMSDLETLKAWHSEALFATDADAARRLADKIQKA
jgi:predicted transposase YdaD